MKKLLLGVVLMLVSSIATSASITLTPTYADNVVAGTILTGDSNQRTIWNISAANDLGTADSLSFDLAVGASSPRNFANNNWTISILNAADEVISSGIPLTTPLGSFTLVAGDSIKVVVLGLFGNGSPSAYSTSLSISSVTANFNVSEVPLPAAVWLFGSVLLGGLAFRRKAAQKRQLALAV